MLDDRTGTSRIPAPNSGQLVWTAQNNRFGWRAFLGVEPGTDQVIGGVPARTKSLAGLPPAFIAVGGIDLFVEEDIAYAQRLIEAGVPAELHVYPGDTTDFICSFRARPSRSNSMPSWKAPCAGGLAISEPSEVGAHGSESKSGDAKQEQRK